MHNDLISREWLKDAFDKWRCKMNTDQILKVLKNKRECIKRQSGVEAPDGSVGICDRNCGECSLCLPDTEILEVYDFLINGYELLQNEGSEDFIKAFGINDVSTKVENIPAKLEVSSPIVIDCKYYLPCGRCDKTGGFCSQLDGVQPTSFVLPTEYTTSTSEREAKKNDK